MDKELDQEHINQIAKMYAEQILGESMKIATAMVEGAMVRASVIGNEAQKMSEVINIEAIKKAVKDGKNT